MPYFYTTVLLFSGVAAGFLNVLAGGGSLLTMPALIFLGLPVAVANGSNRIALIFQNFVAGFSFRGKGYFDWKTGLFLSLPAVVGSLAGARLAIFMPGALFEKLLAVVMVIVIAFIVRQPRQPKKQEEITFNRQRMVLSQAMFFLIGFYGGLVQAGVGFIIIAALSLTTNFSLVKINSLKVMVVFIYLCSSFAEFALHGDVDYVWGGVLAIGMGVGSWLGTHVAVTKGEKWIKIVMVVAVILAAARLFFLK